MNFGSIFTGSFLTGSTIRPDGTYLPFSADAWKYAGEMTLLGMLMVFSVLAILWIVLAVFKLIFVGGEPKKKQVKTPADEVVATPVEEPEENIVSVEDNDNISGELLAVITAAVAAYMAEENGGEVPAGGFRVVSFKRTGARAWNAK